MQLELCLNEFTLYPNWLINELFKNASQKNAVLSRLSGHLHISKEKKMFNSIKKFEFNYCHHTPEHRRTWLTNYMKDHSGYMEWLYSSNVNELLEKNNDICNDHRNIQTFSIEVLKNEKRARFSVNGVKIKWDSQYFGIVGIIQ